MKIIWRRLTYGLTAGAIAGIVSGALAVLVWSVGDVVYKMMIGARLGASEPVTPQQALGNAIVSPVCFGAPFGLAIGGIIGALAGLVIAERINDAPRAGLWLGVVLMLVMTPVFLTLFSQMPLLLIANGMIGAFGGWLGGVVYRRRH